jgi:hypothetical protein
LQNPQNFQFCVNIGKRKNHHTNCTFGFCQRSMPKHKKPKEQFLAYALLKIATKNVNLPLK